MPCCLTGTAYDEGRGEIRRLNVIAVPKRCGELHSCLGKQVLCSPRYFFSSPGDVNGRRQFLNDDSTEKVPEWCRERKGPLHGGAITKLLCQALGTNRDTYLAGGAQSSQRDPSLNPTIQALFFSLNGHCKSFAIDSFTVNGNGGGRAGGGAGNEDLAVSKSKNKWHCHRAPCGSQVYASPPLPVLGGEELRWSHKTGCVRNTPRITFHVFFSKWGSFGIHAEAF